MTTVARPLLRVLAASAALLVSACAWTAPAGQTDAPAPPGWWLVFADEFDRDGPPDPEIWTPELGYVRNEEAQYYTARAENLRIENGLLVIEARKERYQGFSFTSASLATIDHRHFRYGRVEVRTKLPSARGTWPAAWLLGADIGEVGWPASGEIDVMEHVGHDPGRIYGTVHTATHNHLLANAKGGSIEVNSATAAFHLYAVEWSPERIDFFVDERRYHTVHKDGDGDDAWPFDKPFYLILNLAIGGNWGGERGIDDAAFPQRFLIDHVRVYRARGEEPAAGTARPLRLAAAPQLLPPPRRR